MKRRPRLGQHFLSARRYAERIAGALEMGRDELVIEIGAGQGALTGLLAERAGRVLALELDEALAAGLEEQFRDRPSVQILRGDVLEADFSELCRRAGQTRCTVLGNLPYYITSPILHRLFEHRASIRAMALLMQKEVAERLTAVPGTSAYGYLSVLCQAFSQPRLAFRVPPGAFTPPPRVQSALVTFRMVSSLPVPAAQQPEEFLLLVQRAFAHKRKKLVNNLAAHYARQTLAEALDRLDLAPTVRAEELSVAAFAKLFLALNES